VTAQYPGFVCTGQQISARDINSSTDRTILTSSSSIIAPNCPQTTPTYHEIVMKSLLWAKQMSVRAMIGAAAHELPTSNQIAGRACLASRQARDGVRGKPQRLRKELRNGILKPGRSCAAACRASRAPRKHKLDQERSVRCRLPHRFHKLSHCRPPCRRHARRNPQPRPSHRPPHPQQRLPVAGRLLAPTDRASGFLNPGYGPPELTANETCRTGDALPGSSAPCR
jgi:hypothetical protein